MQALSIQGAIILSFCLSLSQDITEKLLFHKPDDPLQFILKEVGCLAEALWGQGQLWCAHQNHGQLRTVSLTVCLLCWEEEKHRQQQSAWGARHHVCSEREERYGRVEEEWGEHALELPER